MIPQGRNQRLVGLMLAFALIVGIAVPFGLGIATAPPAEAATVCGPATDTACNGGVPTASQVPYCYVSQVDQDFTLSNVTIKSSTSYLFDGTYTYPGGGSGTWRLNVGGPVATTTSSVYHQGPAWGESPAGGFFVVLYGSTVNAQFSTTPTNSPATVEQAAIVANIEATYPEWPYQNRFQSKYDTYSFRWYGGGTATVIDPLNQTDRPNGYQGQSGFVLRQPTPTLNPYLQWRVISPPNITQLNMSASGGGAFEGFKFTGIAKYVSCVQLTKVGQFVDANNDGYSSPGEQIKYTYVVKNPGDNPLTNVTLTDPGVTFSQNNLTIPAGGSVTVTGTYSVTLDDIIAGQVKGNATATGQDTFGLSLSDLSDDPTVAANVDVNSNGEPDDPTTVPLLPPPPIDLSITKTDLVDPVAYGDTVTYSVTVKNNGSDTLLPEETITVVDTLPSGLTAPTYTPSAGTYAAGTGAWTGLSLAPGQSATLTVTAKASVSGRKVTNTATVTGPSYRTDPDVTNNTATQDTTITPRADLVVTKTDLVDPVAAGRTITWNVSVTNKGPDVATAVALTDVVPSTLTNVTVSPTTQCSLSGSTVNCAFGTLAVGATKTITITGTVPSTTAPGTVITNTASATTTSTETNATNNSATQPTTITASADVVVVKTSTPNPYVPGEPVTYTIKARNNGPSLAQDLTIVDDLNGLGLSDITVTSPSSGCSVDSNVLTCSLASLAVNAEQEVTFTAVVDSSRLGSLTNVAKVSATTPDPDTSNNTATNVNSADPKADLVLTKTDSVDPVIAGQNMSYTLSVLNAGPSDARDVVLTDTLPSNVTVVSGPTIVTNNAAGTGTCSTECTFPVVAAGETVRVKYTVTVPADTVPGAKVISNTATVKTTTNDVKPENNTVTETTDVIAVADLSITKVSTTYTPGDQLTYTVTVRNSGPSAITGTKLADTLPPEVIFASADDACVQDSGDSQLIICEVGPLGVGESQSFSITVDTDPIGNGDIVNKASVSPAPNTTDPTLANNDTSTSTSPEPNADLGVTKSDSADPIAAGTELSWTMTVTSAGPSAAVGAWLKDQLPAEALNATVSSTVGTCAIDPSNVLECDLATLEPGDVATVTVTADIDSTTADGTVLTNTASVGSTTPDLNSGNNNDTQTTAVQSLADISIVKTADPYPYVPGSPMAFTFHVSNNGPSTATEVGFEDPELPANLSNLEYGIETGEGTCDLSGTSFVCKGITLEPFADFVVTVKADTDSAFLDSITNTAKLIPPSTYTDPNPENDASTIEVPAAAEANLSVSKVANNDTVLAGTELGWTMTVRQGGPTTAFATTITDTLPAGVTYVDATVRAPYSGTCSEASGTVTCDLADLEPGAIVVVDVVTAVPSSANVGDTLENTVEVSSKTPDSDTSDNKTTAKATVDREADIVVTKTDLADPVIAGGEATWTVLVHNLGPSDATALSVQDDLPPGFTLTAISSTSGNCDLATATCSDGKVLAGEDATITLTATVDPDYLITGLENPAVNAVTATIAETDPNLGDNSDKEETLVVADVDLVLTKTGPVTAGAGESLEWTLQFENKGPSTAANVVLTDEFPAGVTVDKVTFDPDTIDPAAVCSSLSPLRCGGDDFPPGQKISVIVSATLDSDYVVQGLPETMTNTAQLTTDSPDRDLSTNTASADTTVGELASLSVKKSASAATVTAGTDVVWTMEVHNAGPSTARAVELVDTIPTGFTVSTMTADSGGECAPSGTCTLGDIAVDATVIVTLTGQVEPRNVADTMTNSVQVTAITTDDNPEDNSADATISLARSADLELVKTGPATVVPGEPVTYTVSITNNGPSLSDGVVVTDTIPAGLTGVTTSTSNGECTTDTCDLGYLDPGQTETVTVTGILDPAFTGATLTNEATVTAVTADPNPGNNTDKTVADVTAVADVSIVKDDVADPVTAGEGLAWNLTVTNAGPSVARTVTVTDPLPLGVAIDTIPASCEAGAQIVCDLGDLAPGDTVVLPITVTVSPDYYASSLSSPLTNTAIVQTDTTDPQPSNNSSTEATTVAATAGIAITKEATTGSVEAGGTVTWVLTAVNNGPTTAQDVTVTDPTPAGTTVSSATADNGASCSGTSTVTCALGSLAPGQQATVTIVASVAADYVSAGLTNPLVNTASIGSSTPDDTPDDNRATDSVQVTDTADLVVAKTGPDTVTAGEDAQWTVTVINNGPSVSRDVVIDDTLPVGVTGATASSTQGTCFGSIHCDLGNLAVGQTVSITVKATIPSDWFVTSHPATITNSVAANAATTDADVTNNTATAASTVTESAVVTATKTATPDTLIAGQPVNWTILVHNDGPSDARNVIVADPLPDGVTGVSARTSGNDTCDLSVSCTIGSIPSGSTVTITIAGMLDASWFTDGRASTVTNSVDITTDTNPGQKTTATVTSPVDDAVDLVVVKEDLLDLVNAGEPVVWQLTVLNTGPSDSPDTVLTDTLPLGLDPASITAPGCTVDISADPATLRCDFGTLAAGAARQVTVSATVLPDFLLTQSNPMINSAIATSGATELNPDNNTGLDTTQIASTAGVAIAKTANVPRLAAGEEVIWTLQVHNFGPSVAEAVHVSDPVPAGVTIDDVSAEGTTTCTAAADANDSGSVECDLGDLAVNGEILIMVTGTITERWVVDGLGDTDGNLVNVATVTTTSADPEPKDNTATSITQIEERADLKATKTAAGPDGAESATAGQSMTWTITVRNDGPSVSRTVHITDPMPAGVTVDSVTPSVISGSSQTVSCSETDGVVECDVAELASGESFTVDIAVTVDPSYITDGNPASLTNAAEVSADTADPTPETPSVSIPVVDSAHLAITKSASPAPVVAGEAITWQIAVANEGPSDAQGVTVDDPLPSIVTPTNITVTGNGQCSIDAVCTWDTIPAGETVTVDIVAQVDPGAVIEGNATVTNAATVSAKTPDPDPAPPATVTTDIAEKADISIVKTDVFDPAIAGTAIQWLVTVTNAGPSDATNVVVADPIPDGITVTSAVVSDGSECTTAVECTIGRLPAGQSRTVTITGVVDATWYQDGRDGSLTNTVDVTADQPDPDSSNNTASQDTTIAATAGLSIAKDVSPAALIAGEPVTWTITVLNSGPSTALNAVVGDSIPEHVTVTSVDAPEGVSCDGTITCTVDSLVSSGEIVLTVHGMVDADAAVAGVSEVANTATVSSDTPDVEFADNTATATAPVAGSADLSLVKTVGEAAVAGGNLTWTLTVHNDGPSMAAGVTLTDALPDELTLVSASSDRGDTCTDDVVCDLGTVDANETITITIITAVPVGEDTVPVLNAASVTSDTADPDESNNTAGATGTALGAALTLVKTVEGDPVRNDDGTFTITYSFAIANVGDSPMYNVQLVDDLTTTFADAPSFSVVAVTSTTFTVNTAFDGKRDTNLLAGTDTLAPGDTGTVSAAVDVESAGGDTFGNLADITGSPVDGLVVTTGSSNGTDPVGVATEVTLGPVIPPTPTPTSTPTDTPTPSPTSTDGPKLPVTDGDDDSNLAVTGGSAPLWLLPLAGGFLLLGLGALLGFRRREEESVRATSRS